jgi:hypothetical protein
MPRNTSVTLGEDFERFIRLAVSNPRARSASGRCKSLLTLAGIIDQTTGRWQCLQSGQLPTSVAGQKRKFRFEVAIA